MLAVAVEKQSEAGECTSAKRHAESNTYFGRRA